MHFDTISMGLPIVYFKRSQVEFSKLGDTCIQIFIWGGISLDIRLRQHVLTFSLLVAPIRPAAASCIKPLAICIYYLANQ